VREIADENTLSGKKKIFFAQKVHVEINDNVSENIILRYGDSNKKWYLSDLTSLGFTELCPLESDSVVTVTKKEPYRISQVEAKRILETSGYGFGKVDVLANGSMEFYVTV
jgi:hypothetical protein